MWWVEEWKQKLWEFSEILDISVSRIICKKCIFWKMWFIYRTELRLKRKIHALMSFVFGKWSLYQLLIEGSRKVFSYALGLTYKYRTFMPNLISLTFLIANNQKKLKSKKGFTCYILVCNLDNLNLSTIYGQKIKFVITHWLWN